MKNKFQIFGSKSSLDLDVMVFVDEIPLKPNISHEMEIEFNNQIKLFTKTNKEVNSNLCVLSEDGIIQNVSKGTIDEVNNSMFHTYDLHEQYYPNQIERLVNRDVELKILRTLRVLLSLISRTEYRVFVKKALREEYSEKVETLLLCSVSDLNEENYINKNVKFEDFIKVYAFQLGQTLGLIDGYELYTKEEIIEYNLLLKPFIMRNVKVCNMSVLNNVKNVFLQRVKNMELKNKFEYKL